MAVTITVTSAGSNISSTLDIYYSTDYTTFTYLTNVPKSTLTSGYTFTPPVGAVAYQVRDKSTCNAIKTLYCGTPPTTTTTTTAPPTTTTTTTAAPVTTTTTTTPSPTTTTTTTPYVGPSTTTTTTTIVLATVTTDDVIASSETSATIAATVVYDGGSYVTERGIVWDTVVDPVIGVGTKVAASTAGSGPYSVAITGLNPGNTYYFRAYAINAKGTAYGTSVYTATQMYELLSTSKLNTWTDASTACADIGGYIDQLWTADKPFGVGSYVYTTNGTSSPFNGGGKWFSIKFPDSASAYSVLINTLGGITNIATCTPRGAYGSVNFIPNGTSVHPKSITGLTWNLANINLSSTVYSDQSPNSVANVLIQNDLDAEHTFTIPVSGTAGTTDYAEFIDSTGLSQMTRYNGTTPTFLGTINDGKRWKVNFYTNLAAKYELKSLTSQPGNVTLAIVIKITNPFPYQITPTFTVNHNSTNGSITFTANANTSALYSGTIDMSGIMVAGYDFTISTGEVPTNNVICNNTKVLDYNDATIYDPAYYAKTTGPYFTVKSYPVSGGNCGVASDAVIYSITPLELHRYYPVYSNVGEVIGVYGILGTTADPSGAIDFDVTGISYSSCKTAASSPSV